jgi:hypothetical protein
MMPLLAPGETFFVPTGGCFAVEEEFPAVGFFFVGERVGDGRIRGAGHREQDEGRN